MSEQFKQYDELSFTDDFLFCKVLENNEDLCKVFLTPDGIAEDVSEELADFLNYLAGRGGSSSFVKRLDEAVNRAKGREEWRMEYMTLFMRDREKYEEGKAETRISIIRKMIAKDYSREAILDLGFTEEEYAEAEKAPDEYSSKTT